MLVKVVYLKDANGYKAGQEWAMLLSYAERFQREGVVRILEGDVDRWVLPPQPEDEEEDDDDTWDYPEFELDDEEEEDEPTEPQKEEGSFMRFFNNKNK